MPLLRRLVNTVRHPGELTVSLALGGGAARGIAHIGVLKAIEDFGVHVDSVAGTSAGAIIGSLYCKGYSSKEIWEVVAGLSWGELVNLSFSGMGLAKTDKLEKLLRELLGDCEFSELGTPFRAVAVDISNAEEVILETGNVARAALASAAIPGIFEPVKIAGRYLVDGGVSNNVPTEVVAAMGGGKLLAVDLNASRADQTEPKNMVDVTLKTFAVLMWNMSKRGREAAELLVQPDLDGFRYHDLARAEELFRRGEEAARQVLEPYV